MPDKNFLHTELLLPEPKFGSELTSLVVELEHLRKLKLSGSTYPPIFFELKQLFHSLESLGSARIEGNNTTIAQFMETKLEERPFINEQIQEIRNIEKAMQWVDEVSSDYPMNRAFVCELHKIIVEGLTPPPEGEGDFTPGEFRSSLVKINNSDHVPPPPFLVGELMDELFGFIENEIPSQFDLLRIAVAHHRFMWIHPFGNGNGRVGRLVTYAMLVKTGFKVHVGQILNPTAIFCIDRKLYNKKLSIADLGTSEALEDWCNYVLSGLKVEIEKIERLANEKYVFDKLLLPALDYSHKMKYIDKDEYKILKLAAQAKTIKVNDLKSVFKTVHPVTISRKIKALKDKNMLKAKSPNRKIYYLSFINNFLIRGMINSLETEGYIPIKD